MSDIIQPVIDVLSSTYRFIWCPLEGGLQPVLTDTFMPRPPGQRLGRRRSRKRGPSGITNEEDNSGDADSEGGTASYSEPPKGPTSGGGSRSSSSRNAIDLRGASMMQHIQNSRLAGYQTSVGAAKVKFLASLLSSHSSERVRWIECSSSHDGYGLCSRSAVKLM